METQDLQKIITEWKEGNEKPFQQLYRKLYDRTFYSIKKRTKSATAAEEIFMEGLHTFLEHFFIGEKKLPENIFSYFYRMCYNIWYDSHIKQKHPHLFNDQLEIPDIEESISEKEDRTDQLKKVAWARAIERLTGLCKEIFKSHIEERQRLKSLWSVMGFKNYQSLVQANYRCKQKLTQLVLDEFDSLMNN